MKEQHPHLQIDIYTVDGSARRFLQDDPSLADRTLSDLHPALIFTQERITIADEGAEVAVAPTLITRIDLVTDRWSVWDFPFVLGAPVEVTEAEFLQGIHDLPQWEQPNPSSEIPVFLDIEMLNGQRLFLWMRVAAGVSRARLGKIYSLLKERYLIFGLRTMGIGILNLSNLVRLSVHPEPPKVFVDGDTWPHKRETRRQPANGKPRSIHSLDLNPVALELKEHQQTGSATHCERGH